MLYVCFQTCLFKGEGGGEGGGGPPGLGTGVGAWVGWVCSECVGCVQKPTSTQIPNLQKKTKCGVWEESKLWG